MFKASPDKGNEEALSQKQNEKAKSLEVWVKS
jgi:hypothetical protein